MKNSKTLLIAAILFVGTGSAFAQNVAINSDGSSPNSSAMLDVKSSSKGFLPPRLSLTGTDDVATISSPATGLLVYNISTTGNAPSNVSPGYYFWNGFSWVALGITALASQVTGILPLANGGTGSAFKNFVDISTDQTVAGNKILSGNTSLGGTLNVLGKVGIGTTTPESSAALEIRSTTSGFLLPRMTTSERDAMVPVKGMMIYNTTLNRFQGCNDVISPSNDACNISSGSSMICDAQHFLGQSFTAVNTCNSLGIDIYIGSVDVAGSFELRVYEGNGMDGNNTSRTSQIISDSGIIHFHTLTYLVSGNQYTIQLRTIDNNARINWTSSKDTDDYAGGHIWTNESPNTSRDLWFRMNINSSETNWVDLNNY